MKLTFVFIMGILIARSTPAFAQTKRTRWIDADLGLASTPEMYLSDNYTVALGLNGNLAVRWQPGAYGYLLNFQEQSYEQQSRHAGADTETESVGVGLMNTNTTGVSVYVLPSIGRGRYHVKNDGQPVFDGSKTFFKFTSGVRWNNQVNDWLNWFFGVELSYSTFGFAYPAGYMDDQTSPIHFNVGGNIGLSCGF